jgi:iron(III) transport system substrate-binding protein
MRRTRLVALVATALIVASTAGACSSGGDRLTVYSGRTENLIGPLLEQFAEDTGIGVDVRYGQSADLALLIDEEGDRSPADVFISQSPGAIGFLAERDRLRPLDQVGLDLVPSDSADAEGRWVGLSARVRTLVYNTEQVDAADLPDSVFDLTDEQYAGQVALAPENGSFQDFVTGMRVELGDDTAADWLDTMASNDAPTFANNTAIVEAVGRGEVPMGLVNHYYNVRALAEDPSTPSENAGFAEGDIGNLLIDTAAGLIDSTSRPEDANRLIEFLLSAEAQRFFSEETFEYPLAAGVDPLDALTPLGDLAVTRVDVGALAGGLTESQALIDASGL